MIENVFENLCKKFYRVKVFEIEFEFFFGFENDFGNAYRML